MGASSLDSLRWPSLGQARRTLLTIISLMFFPSQGAGESRKETQRNRDLLGAGKKQALLLVVIVAFAVV